MSISLLTSINWQAPWYHTLAIPSITDSSMPDSLTPDNDSCHVKDWLNHASPKNPPITNAQHIPIQFVSQHDLPPNTAYETFIAQTGKIPTRDNLHDLLNGLIWLNYPKTKAVLNYLHTVDIAKNGINSHRSPLRNALTLFDENGGIVVSSNIKLLTDLQNFNWENALFNEREQWSPPKQSGLFFPLGHALLEKLSQPRKNITSHALLLQVESEFFTLSIDEQRKKLDSRLAEYFLANFQAILQSKNFQPLPVMGIAGYCEGNNKKEFYLDKSVFREAREKKALILPLFAS